MGLDLPTESITGRHEWTWNQTQAELNAPSDSAAMSAHQNRTPLHGAISREQDVMLWREIAEMDAALERKDQQIQQIITQYERLLAEKNQALEQADVGASSPTQRIAVLSRLLRDLIS